MSGHPWLALPDADLAAVMRALLADEPGYDPYISVIGGLVIIDGSTEVPADLAERLLVPPGGWS